ncbi:Endoribonuclease L-PSP/chorismate mutase-like protein [Leptodontidium sp. 2 PMI_412]|nr:Endoribonuclease L-PSP/chorismate mutase-like protein [Leptodontidium sp. MPI-SDFR-AT-0119]KAH9221618.1 Endoribonuclease L-PSP/chorismate mutase-like protein [Leptodontidium sp. 2 PMI_412]
MPGEIKAILCPEACAFPPGLFHHAKIHNGVVYCAGQVGANVEGKLVSEDVGPQTEKTLENIKNILQSAGSSLERVLKVNIYMPEQADYAGMNEVYKRIMPDPKPPRACVFVKGLPGGAKVEIECIAAQD